LAGGLLTGKHSFAQGPTSGTRFTLGAAAERYQERYWHDREFNTVEALRTVADHAGLSLTTLAIAWVLSNPIITAPIIGASSPEQLTDTLKAGEKQLDDTLKQKLDELTAEYRKGDSVR
jgi:aryl-alcohol dehydrogenase (NADP+)